jgi:hypothetical protein
MAWACSACLPVGRVDPERRLPSTRAQAEGAPPIGSKDSFERTGLKTFSLKSDFHILGLPYNFSNSN